MATGTHTDDTAATRASALGRADGFVRLGVRGRRRVVWALAGLAAAVGLALVLVLGPNKDAPPQHLSQIPAIEPPTQVKAPLSAEARRVAIRFIQTAVAREHLDEAWTLVGPNLRGGLTRKQFLSGEIPVVPFPIDKLDVAPYKIDESYKTSALLEIALLPKQGSGIRSQVFFLELKRIGAGKKARWVVDNWVPRAAPVVPR